MRCSCTRRSTSGHGICDLGWQTAAVAVAKQRTIRTANDEFQLLSALLTNRNKRYRQGRFLVQGVRNINAAIAAGWPIEAVLMSDSATSAWAGELAAKARPREVIRMPAALLDELSEREDGAEAVLVATAPGAALSEVAWREGPIVVAEGIKGPGNLGTILRSADALGAGGVIVTGHAADPYDPVCVRASTGALFVVPHAVGASVAAVIADIRRVAVGLDPDGEPIDEAEFPRDALLIAGTESTGLSAKARELCEMLVSIPMAGATASLNVATATSIALAEIARRRRAGIV